MTITTSAPRHVPPARPSPRRPIFIVFLILFRAVATVHAGLALVQPVSIGQYLDGRYGLLQWHGTTAGLMILSSMVLSAVVLGYVFSGGRVWALSAGLLFLVEGIQTGLGYNRDLGVHVPLGVAIVALALLVAVLAWTRPTGYPRLPRTPRRAGELA